MCLSAKVRGQRDALDVYVYVSKFIQNLHTLLDCVCAGAPWPTRWPLAICCKDISFSPYVVHHLLLPLSPLLDTREVARVIHAVDERAPRRGARDAWLKAACPFRGGLEDIRQLRKTCIGLGLESADTRKVSPHQLVSTGSLEHLGFMVQVGTSGFHGSGWNIWVSWFRSDIA